MNDLPRAGVEFAVAGQRRPEVAVFGEWNTSNLGDRGIHHGVLRFLEECGWAPRSYGVSTLTPLPADAGLRPVPSVTTGRVSGMLECAPALKRSLRGVRQRLRIAALMPALRESRAIVVGGGALLSDANLHFPQSLVQLARSARRLGKPLLCLGCSIEGEWSPAGGRMIREFLSSCDLIAVRDGATAERLRAELGSAPPVFGDFCLEERACIDNGAGLPAGRYAYAINAGRLPLAWAASQDRYEDALVALINRLGRRAEQGRSGVLVFTTGPEEDMRVAQRVFSRVKGVGRELHLPRNLGQLFTMLRASEVVIATRLHAAILAMAEHAPVIGFSAGTKLRDFFGTLGMRHCVYDIAELPRLSDWLSGADYGQLQDEQRRALATAPFWAERARVRRSLGLMAAGTP